MSAWRFERYFLLRATGVPIERLLAVADAAAPTTGWSERVERERLALFTALGDELAREAILTSAPLVDQNFDGWRAHAESGRRNAQDKKRERVLWRFLQRLTAKNDSTSFFGAVAAGDFTRALDPEAPLPIEVGRRVYATQWVIERLLARAIDALRAEGVHVPAPRRAPGVDQEGRRWVPGGRGFARDDDAPREVDREALPSGLVDPIGEARARLLSEPASATRDRWVAHLEEVEALRERHARTAGDLVARREVLAATDETVSALLGESARRHEGEFYASRSPLHEQADRTGAVIGLPAGWAEGLERAAAPFLELAMLLQAPERVVMRAWFKRTFACSRTAPVPWREVLDAIAEAPLMLELAATPAVREARTLARAIRAELREAIDEALARDPGVEEVRLDPARFEARIAQALSALAPLGTAYANPDFMIAQVADEVRFVLAEAHHLPCLTPCLLPSLAAEATLVEATRARLDALCAPDRPAFPVSYDHSFISVGPDLGAVGLELSGLAKEPPERRATMAELAVYADDDGTLRFIVPSHAGAQLGVAPLTRTARLHQASPVFPLACPDLGAWLAGSDWRPLEAIPRLSYGALIVHRRRFRLDPGDRAEVDAGRARELLASRAGLTRAPRFMFAHMPSEPKPILIDWGSALATELAAWALGRGETLALSEMLPDPDGLWLRSAAGRHTAELRTVLTRRR